MLDKIEKIRKEATKKIKRCKDLKGLHNLKVFYIGRKGEITKILKNIKKVAKEERPIVGKEANLLKNEVLRQIEEKRKNLKREKQEKKRKSLHLDVTLPGEKISTGHKHPLSYIIEETCEIFSNIGFEIVQGPEVETEYHNFEALNIPIDHPSRDVFDTFYIEQKNNGKSNKTHKSLLRSQTSTVQIRIMEKQSPPLKIVAPGKAYRPDTPDASHSFMFHQIEGLLVDKDIRFSHLKGTLLYFVKSLFGNKVKIKFRPHFFPFTEPSAEVDISCIICQGSGCSVCSGKGWLEILGAGMVDPNVFKAVGYPEDKYTGFAFGMGVERIAMLKYGICDIRDFFENDIRFLNQF